MSELEALLTRFYELSSQYPDSIFRIRPTYPSEGMDSWVAGYVKSGRWWEWTGEGETPIEKLEDALLGAVCAFEQLTDEVMDGVVGSETGFMPDISQWKKRR